MFSLAHKYFNPIALIEHHHISLLSIICICCMLWERIGIKLGVQREGNVIRIVVDKPVYLP